MNKVIKKGKVAVLISPGFGAGWSTWNDDPKIIEIMLFHPQLIEIVAQEKREIITESLLKQICNTENHICTLGSDQLEIIWLPQGTAFSIWEYDGSESIITKEDLNFIA